MKNISKIQSDKNPIGIEQNKQNFPEKINEKELENCINLKKNITNRPNSRKRSAFKFIENLEGKNFNDIENNEINNQKINKSKDLYNFEKETKPNIINEKSNNKFIQNSNNLNMLHKNNFEKKIEYESRRKKPMHFINEIDNFSNKIEGNKTESSRNLKIQEINSIIGYESRRQINFQKNNTIKIKEDNENNG